MKWFRFVISMEFRKILAYRSDFWVTFLGQTLVQLLVARALWQSIFQSQNVTEMNGYTLQTMTLYYLIVPLGIKILSGENIGFIAREIYDGSFSRYLIYPLSVFSYKSCTFLTHSFFYALQLILIVLIFCGFFYPEFLTAHFFGSLVIGTFLFLLGAVAYLMMALFIELLALWADNIWSLMVMFRFFTSFLGGGFIPLSFFPLWARDFLQLTPFPYLISLPLKTIMGQNTPIEILTGMVVLVVWILFFKLAVKVLWAKGQLRYSGVGQ
jgi:ABC-2 type transport system permease protein